MPKKIVLVWMIVLLSILHAGCAPKKPAMDAVSGPIVWPPAPEEPRIAYINSFHGAMDFYKPSFFETIFGTPPRSFLHKPSAVYVADDSIYVALAGDAAVAVMKPREQSITRISDWGRGKLGLPLGLAGLPDGTLYVSDSTAKAIVVFDREGNFKFDFGRNELKNPAGIAFNTDHSRLYVADSKEHDVKVFSPDGKLLFKFGSEGKTPGSFYFPATVAVNPKTGNLCIVDTQNFRVQIFDKDGKFIRTIGELGDLPGTFSRPRGAAFDSEGHLYVSDYAFGNIQIFTEEGQLLLWLGSSGTMPGYFQLPAGLFIDGRNRIYVADSMNNRVQIFQYLSESWKHDFPEEYKTYVTGAGTISTQK